MNIKLIRHATLWLEYRGKNILVDPMLGDVGAYPPIQGSSNDRRNPLVPLPVSKESISRPDAVIITHLHNDHWDPVAVETLAKEIPLFCQPGDEDILKKQGFTHVTTVETEINWSNISFCRTEGAHGKGDIGVKMGQVSGFILRAHDEPSVYIAGDTIFYPRVEEVLTTFQPDVVVVNAGGARFAVGDAITMTPDDVISVCRTAPDSHVVAVHMDAINHCLDTRAILRERLAGAGLLNAVSIPADGETVTFNK